MRREGVYFKPSGDKSSWKLLFQHKLSGFIGRILKSFGNLLIIGSWHQLHFIEIEDNLNIKKKLRTKKLEILDDRIRDFIGYKSQMVVILTFENKLFLYKIKKTRIKFLKKKKLKGEKGGSMTICDKNSYLFVSERNENSISTGIRVFKIDKGDLKEIYYLSTEELNLRDFRGFSFSNYIKNSIIIVGVSSEDESWILTFRYDLQGGFLEEVQDLKRKLEIRDIWNFNRREEDGVVYGACWDGRVMEIGYLVKEG